MYMSNINIVLAAVIIILAISAGFFFLSSKKTDYVKPGEVPGFILEEAKKGTGNVDVGSDPPQFTLTNLKTGEEFDLDDLKGKAVFIEFGSTLCGICAFDMKNLDKFVTNNKNILEDRLEVLWINTDPTETAAEVLRYSRSYDNAGEWIWTLDSDKVAIRYGAPFTGTTYIINKEGKVSYKDGANTYYDVIAKEIQKALS